MRLVDTSSWIEQLRRGGDAAVRERVEALLMAGEAAWCPIVRLELWNGARSERKRSQEAGAHTPITFTRSPAACRSMCSESLSTSSCRRVRRSL